MRDQIKSLIERYVGPLGRERGDSNILIKCPLGIHTDNTPSFSVNIDKGIYHCFACHSSGGMKKLLLSVGVPENIVEQETKGIQAAIKYNMEELKYQRQAEWIRRDPFEAETALPEAVSRFFQNNRMSFSYDPTGLTTHGFYSDILQKMEVGYDSKTGRIIYPVKDIYGNLAGCVGGAPSKNVYPKYKVYMGRQQMPDGSYIPSDYGNWFDDQFPEYRFQNHNFLWNYSQVYPRIFFGGEEGALILVEGFKACMWLVQCGYTNTVALMGSSLSRLQKQQILKVRNKVVLFLDNDTAGQRATQTIFGDLRYTSLTGIFCARYPQNTLGYQPDDLRLEQVREAVASAWVTPPN